MKTLSLISMLIITMASTPLLAMDLDTTETEKNHVSQAFTVYVSNNQHISLEDLLHDMQLNDFSSDGVTFTYLYKDIYKKNVESNPHYPRTIPLGAPEVAEVSNSYIKTKWPEGGITPCLFITEFYCTINNGENINLLSNKNINSNEELSLKKTIKQINFNNINTNNNDFLPKQKSVSIISSPQVLQSEIDTLFPNDKQVDEMKSYMAKMGYDGENFNYHTFAKWYGKTFMRYKKGGNIGFNEKDQPIVFNLPHGESFGPHLPLLNGFRALLPCYFLYQPELDSKTLLKTIYQNLPNIALRLEDDRERLTIKDGLVYGQSNEIQTLEGRVYGVDKKGNLYYVKGRENPHHDAALEGKDGLCSGYISVVDGKIKSISNISGHYRPHIYHLYVLVESLLSKEVLLSNSKIEYYIQSPQGDIIKKVPLEEFLSLDKNELRSQWEKMVQERINEKDYKFFQSIISEINRE